MAQPPTRQSVPGAGYRSPVSFASTAVGGRTRGLQPAVSVQFLYYSEVDLHVPFISACSFFPAFSEHPVS
jgi:hypothetical protein